MERKISELFANVWFAIVTSFRASKLYFLMKLFTLLSTTAIPLVNLWLWKEVLNGIAEFETARKTVLICLGVYLGLKLAAYLLRVFDSYVNRRYGDELWFYIDKVMMDKTSRMDLAFFDSAKMGDKISRTRSNFDAMTNMTWMVFDIIFSAVSVVVTLVIVISYKWWIGLITLVLLVPYFIYNKWHAEKRLQMEKDQARDNRKKDYAYEVFYDNNVQFEIKLNSIGDFFLNRFKSIWRDLYRINKKEDIRHNLISIGIMLLGVMSEALVLGFSAMEVVNNAIGIGDLQYNLSMVSRLRSQAENLMWTVNEFLSNGKRLIELREFIAIKPETEKSGDRLPSPNPRIEFKNVSFRYPGTENYVLKNCSFVIESHEKIGLIGLNGAGKSTIVKLMFRFYDPEEGSILFDGVDLKEYDVYAVRKIFGVLFQDYVTYCLPMREIIALSDFNSRFDDEKLARACEISGASEAMASWEQGFDSVLGEHYANNGKHLSGGQWQLVGLARAYFKDTEYMILDEPSAALDPIAEDRIFEQLYRLSEGRSSVTISHRLSNTTLADRILVLENGQIIEQGSHAELLGQNGKYAHLFRLQAEKYV